jgi:lysozyme
MLTGPDVSHWQGAVDWFAVRNAGHAFAWAKATEGTTFVDSRFGDNWAGMQAAGLVRGAYHFLRSEPSPEAQAQHFVSVVGDFGGSMAALDVETSGSGTNPTSGQAHAFAAEFAGLTGGHPLVLYTGRWYWVGVLGDPYGADIGALWHSRFGGDPGPLYGGWGGWAFWQHTDRGFCPGIGNCDLNQFQYDMATLLWLTGVSAPPPEEDDLPYSEIELKNLMRSVLDEGTAPGQLSWAGTSKATLGSIQRTYNAVLASRVHTDELVNKILAQLPASNISRTAVETAVRKSLSELGQNG